MRVIKGMLGPAFPSGATHMDAFQSTQSDLSYDNSPPVILVASSEAAMARAERSMDASRFRVVAKLPVEGAAERIASQPRAGAVWIELDRDCGPAMDEALHQVNRGVCEGHYAAVVSATIDLLDPVSAHLLSSSEIELIADANDADRAASIAIATAMHKASPRVGDLGTDNNADRLRQLSEEVSRIASTLARLSVGPRGQTRVSERPSANDVPPLSVETVRSVINARRVRSRYFREELFADPAWDMMLDLLQAEIAQHRVAVSSLCIAAAVPATTALRWLKTMVSQGIFLRRADPHDGRRVFVELAPEASNALRRYLAEIGQIAVV
jgi:hypothetical protein